MRHLLDTHAFIWFVNGDKEHSAKARKAIESVSAINFLSVASLWEMAIKISLGRLDVLTSFEQIGQQIIKFSDSAHYIPGNINYINASISSQRSL